MTPDDGKSTSSQDLAAILRDIREGTGDGIEPLRALLTCFPESLKVMGNLAWALAQKGHQEEAITLYEKYLSLQPEDPEPEWRIADRLVNLGCLDEAAERYGKVLKTHPDCKDASTGLKYIEYLKRKASKAAQPEAHRHLRLTQKQEENLALNKKEFQQKRFRLKSHPPQMYLESTTKCNYYCRTCEKGYCPYYAEDLQPEIWEKVCAEAMPWNVRISITGFGEPTMAANFDAILETALKNGSYIHFVTNASLLNFSRIEQLTRYPVAMQISIDGATKETFEDIRTGARFEQVCERLAMIKKLRDIYLSEFYSTFSFNFVALRKNIHELPDVLRLAHRYGIMKVGVSDYALGWREFDEQSLRLDPQRANEFIKETQRVAADLGMEIVLPAPYTEVQPPPASTSLWTKIIKSRRLFPKRQRFPQRCRSPWAEPYIHTDGIVTPCCASGQYLGDLRKTPFEKIWNGWRYSFLRWRIESLLPPPGCRRCFVIWGINGGNAGSVLAQEGLLVKAFYFFETRLAGIVQGLFRLLQGAKRPPAPNYCQGRPIMEKDRP
jgi:MoaA/NifB/PqqE/SkfB family radical SAM enzyme